MVRTARYWTLGPTEGGVEEVWFVLHGYRQLAERFLRRFEAIDDGRRLVVAPEGLSRFYTQDGPGRHGPSSRVGATWMTREDREHEIRDYVRYLDRLAEEVLARVDGAPRVVVLGFSQGVATAARWSCLGAVRPASLVLWGDRLPPDLPLERAAAAWGGVELVAVRGDDDPVFAGPAGRDADADLLAGVGLGLRVARYPGGHDIDPAALRALAGTGDQNSPIRPISGTSS